MGRLSGQAAASILMGTVEGVGGQGIFDMLRFDILGTGRPGTDTAGWEYGYQGHLTWPWTNAGDQLPTLVGSVIRAKPHEDSRAGSVYSFIAVKRQPNWASGLTGSWTYRSFHNKTTYVYPTAPPTTRKLILQEAVFKLETPTDTTLQGTIEWPGGVLGIDLTAAEVRPAEVPAEFTFRGIGRPGTSTAGWEYAYHGLLTRHWPTPPLSSWLSHVMSTPNEIDQRPALVGSVFRTKAHGDAPAGSVYPFIAVKQ
jgi:hypothetical protein